MRNDTVRIRRGRDAGGVLLEAIIGLALGAMLILGGVAYYAVQNQNAAAGASVQTKNAAISDALNRTAQSVQVSNPIVYADKDELVIQSADPAGSTQLVTRWINTGGTYYQQSWTEFTGIYKHDPTQWIPVTTATSADKKQGSKVAVGNIAADLANVFTYYDADNNAIPVTSLPLQADNGKTNEIKRVEIKLKAVTPDSGMVEDSTSATPRTSIGGVSDGSIAAPVCPALTLSAASGNAPKLTWTTTPGAAAYVISRNNTQVATVTVPAADSTGTWTDPADLSGMAATYTVQTKDTAGNLSISCRARTWAPVLEAPQFTDSSVTPAGADASSWTASPLAQPRMTIKWGAVPGADGYILSYREVAHPSAAAIGTGSYTTVGTFDNSVTSFTWDGAGWGKRYEWYVTATNNAGYTAESETMHMLAHAAAPSASATAEYLTDADGENVITWTAVPTAAQYEIWRYASGSTGAATRIGTVAGNVLTYADKAAYGTEYTYYVVALNDGPRGVDTSGAIVTDIRPSATPESAATSKPGKATQLQYPPIPAVEPAAAPANGASAMSSGVSTDGDGFNSVAWQPAATASGYEIERYSADGAAIKTCLTGTDCGDTANGAATGDTGDIMVGALSFGDNGVEPASQYDYAVRAYNATGLSIKASEKVRLTQRPAPPAVSITDKPDMGVDQASLQVTANADENGAFCTPTDCGYEVLKDGTAVAAADHTTTGAPIDFANVASDANAVTAFTARSRNQSFYNGGWSDAATVNVVAAPTPANSGIFPEGTESSSWNWVDNAALTEPKTVLNWTAITGAAGYEIWSRPIDLATQAPTGEYTKAADVAADATSWTKTDTGYATQHEYYVVAKAPDGSENTSPSFDIASHPTAPQNASIIPKWDTDTMGNNIISWDPVSTATRYKLYRYADGATSGSLTGIYIGPETTFTDPVGYGTLYNYVVVAQNLAPRGTDASGMETAAAYRASALPNSAATSKPVMAPQLQFPPQADVKPVSATSTDSRDWDGFNRPQWNAAKRASGYHVWRINTITGSGAVCLTASACDPSVVGTTSRSIDDTVAAASQYRYRVRPYNATGFAKHTDTNDVTLTQRPDMPVLNIAQYPALDDTSAIARTYMNADAGNISTNRFCTASTCRYHIYEVPNTMTAVVNVGHTGDTGAAIDYSDPSNAQGVDVDYIAKAKNQAITNNGWSDLKYRTVSTFPGKYNVTRWVGDAYGTGCSTPWTCPKKHQRFVGSIKNSDIEDKDNVVQPGMTTIDWSGSAGASSMVVTRYTSQYGTLQIDDPYLPTTNTISYNHNGAGGIRHTYAGGGGTFWYRIVAEAPNGKQRIYDSNAFTTRPEYPRHMKNILVCAGSYGDWRMIVGAKTKDMNHPPRYGWWDTVKVIGMKGHKSSPGSWTYNNSYSYVRGGSSGTAVNSSGHYWDNGMRVGFDYQTLNADGVDSLRMKTYIQVEGTGQSSLMGCASQGSTGMSMVEPDNACYGWSTSNQVCEANSDSNRPQWSTATR